MGLMKLRAAMLFTFVVLFGTVLGLTGLLVWVIAPDLYAASALGLVTFLVGLTVVITLIQFAIAPYVIRAFTNMRELDHKEFGWIHKMADEICAKAKIKKPKLYLVNDGTPNAFAFGWGKNHAFIALHSGLVEMLNKDEIKAVLAHEIGHVKHRDMVVITVASMVPIFVYYLIIAIGSIVSRNRDDEGHGFSGILVFLGAYIAQFFTYLIVLYLSRTRELYADTFGAAATNPKDMRTALAKIAYGFPLLSGAKVKKYEKNRAFFIADPIAAVSEREQRERDLSKDLERSAEKRAREGRHIDTAREIEEAMKWERERAAAKILNIFSTHPLTYKRIDNLYEFEKSGKHKPEDV